PIACAQGASANTSSPVPATSPNTAAVPQRFAPPAEPTPFTGPAAPDEPDAGAGPLISPGAATTRSSTACDSGVSSRPRRNSVNSSTSAGTRTTDPPPPPITSATGVASPAAACVTVRPGRNLGACAAAQPTTTAATASAAVSR